MKLTESQLRQIIREELANDELVHIWSELGPLQKDLLRIVKHKRISVPNSAWERLKNREYIDRPVDRLHELGLLQNSTVGRLAVTYDGYAVAEYGKRIQTQEAVKKKDSCVALLEAVMSEDDITDFLTAEPYLLEVLSEFAAYTHTPKHHVTDHEAMAQLIEFGLIDEMEDGWVITDLGFRIWRWHPVTVEQYRLSRLKKEARIRGSRPADDVFDILVLDKPAWTTLVRLGWDDDDPEDYEWRLTPDGYVGTHPEYDPLTYDGRSWMIG